MFEVNYESASGQDVRFYTTDIIVAFRLASRARWGYVKHVATGVVVWDSWRVKGKVLYG